MANEEEKKGVVGAPAPAGLGKKQKENASLASDLSDDNPLESQEGVGDTEAYTNPKYGDAVEVNSYDEDGKLKSSEVFERGKKHLVSSELAESDLFLSPEEYENL
jgi:hypothetical protein